MAAQRSKPATPGRNGPRIRRGGAVRTGREYDHVGKWRAYQEAGVPSYWLLDPDGPSATVLELDGDGRYQEVARAVGEDECTLRRPFPVRFRPAVLLR